MILNILRSSTVIASVNIGNDAKFSSKLLAEEAIQFIVNSSTVIPVMIGDTISWNAKTYVLNTLPDIRKTGSNMYQYSFIFEAEWYDLLKVQFLDQGLSTHEFMGTAIDFIDLIVSNMNRFFGSTVYSAGTVLTSIYKNLVFDGENCLEALNQIKDAFDAEYYFSGYQINLVSSIGSATGKSLSYGKGKGLYELIRSNVDSSNIITRLYVQGSERNIAADYRNYSARLLFATAGSNYLDQNTGVYGIREGSIVLDEVYPHRTGIISGVGAALVFSDSGIDFDLNSYLIGGVDATIVFNTGDLAGFEFKLSTFVWATKTFTLLLNKTVKGLELPNATLKPAIGDTYVIVGITLPASYITAAEAELTSKGTAELAKVSSPKVKYTLVPDPLYVEGESLSFAIGDQYTIIDTALGISSLVRILGITQRITDPRYFTIELGENVYVPKGYTMYSGTVALSKKAYGIEKAGDFSDVRRYTETRAAQSTADTGVANAATADGKAVNAQSTATSALANAATANALLADMSADSKITPLEKVALKKEWDNLVANYTALLSTAGSYGIDTLNLQDFYSVLSSYVTPLLVSLTTTSTIVGATFRSNFSNYYVEYATLLNDVVLAANTQTAMNAGITAGKIAGFTLAADMLSFVSGYLYLYLCNAVKTSGYYGRGLTFVDSGADYTTYETAIVAMGQIHPYMSGSVIGAPALTATADYGFEIIRAVGPGYYAHFFRVGKSGAYIGGWKFDQGAIYTGTKHTADGYSASGITLAANGSIHAPNFYINVDGSVMVKNLTLDYSSAGALNLDAENLGNKYNYPGMLAYVNINMDEYQANHTYRLHIGDGHNNIVAAYNSGDHINKFSFVVPTIFTGINNFQGGVILTNVSANKTGTYYLSNSTDNTISNQGASGNITVYLPQTSQVGKVFYIANMGSSLLMYIRCYSTKYLIGKGTNTTIVSGSGYTVPSLTTIMIQAVNSDRYSMI